VGFSQFQSYLPVADSTTAFGVSLSSHNSVVLDEETGNLWQILERAASTDKLMTVTKRLTSGAAPSPADLPFDSDRPTLREKPTGTTIAGTTVQDVLEWDYYTPPVLTCLITGTYPVEVGTSQSVTISGTTVIHGDVLSLGQVNSTGVTDPLTPIFAAAALYSYPITYAPLETPSGDFSEHTYTFDAQQVYLGVESGTATSGNATLTAVYPYFHLVSAVDYTGASGTTIYSNFTKVVEAEGTKSVVFNGTGFSYICVPDTWSALTAAVDHNGFDVFSSYTGIAVTVTAVFGGVMVNVYTDIGYTLYKIATPGTYSSVTYTFTF